jgi:hypothetical protein
MKKHSFTGLFFTPVPCRSTLVLSTPPPLLSITSSSFFVYPLPGEHVGEHQVGHAARGVHVELDHAVHVFGRQLVEVLGGLVDIFLVGKRERQGRGKDMSSREGESITNQNRVRAEAEKARMK